MKKLLSCFVVLATAFMVLAQTPQRTTVQSRGPDGFFGPVIPNHLVFTIKQQIVQELKEYISTNYVPSTVTNKTITVDDVISSSEFQAAVSNSCTTIVTPEMIQDIVGTNVISEAQATTIIQNTNEIKLDNAQFKSGFEFATNVMITADMTVEELKQALIVIIGGLQKSAGGSTNVNVQTAQ